MKKLSAERLAHQREHFARHGFFDDPEIELLGHIAAIEAELAAKAVMLREKAVQWSRDYNALHEKSRAIEAENQRLKDNLADEHKQASEAFCELQNVLRVTTDNLKKEIAENQRLREALDKILRCTDDNSAQDVARAALKETP